jgi:gluconokinase
VKLVTFPTAIVCVHSGSVDSRQTTSLGMEALGLVGGIDRAAELVGIEGVVEPEARAAAVYADLLPTFASLHEAPAFRALERHR